MSRFVVLGGCGAVGRVVVRTLAAFGSCEEVVLADLDVDTASSLAAALTAKAKVTASKVDASDVASVRAAVRSAVVAVNCVGPFYKFARPVLQACIDERVDYVDICDDVDATLELLNMDADVKVAGIRALIGMGNSPGLTNILGRVASDIFLDEVESIDVSHCHGGEEFEGAGVVAHRLHGMGMDIPMYLDGELRNVHFFEKDGIDLQGDVDFYSIGKERVFPYPHPEQITMPQHIRCRRVTNRGTVLPQQYFHLTTEVARASLSGTGPLILGKEEVPRDDAIPWLLRQRDRLLRVLNFGSQKGCMRVAVSGTCGGARADYIFSVASIDGQGALGEGTGIPAACGAILMQQGRASGPGVLPPEAAVRPLDFLNVIEKVLAMEKKRPNGKRFEGLVVQRVRTDGSLVKFRLTKSLIAWCIVTKRLRQTSLLLRLGVSGIAVAVMAGLAWRCGLL